MSRSRQRDYDEDDDDRRPSRKPKRRRRKQSDPTRWIVGGVLGGTGLIVLVIVIIWLVKNSDGNGKDILGKDIGNVGGQRMRQSGNKMYSEEALIESALMMKAQIDPPASWTHQHLADHLKSKGLPVTIVHDPGLRTANGEGVWFVDARPNSKMGRTRVYRCANQRAAALQCIDMNLDGYLPYVVGCFAVGHDAKDNVSDNDLEMDIQVKHRIR